MSLRDQMEKIYRDMLPERIPWNLKEPPDLLADLVRSSRVLPCDAVDFGCGAGNYAVWFAMQGFRMTGIDLSPSALALAGNLAEKHGVSIRLVEADLTQNADRYPTAFDFGYDWEVLHHVFPDDRESYVANVCRMLRPGAIYFSMCFSDSDRAFGGRGKYRKTMLDTMLYFSSEDEIEQLFIPYFRVIELKTIEIAGKYGPHMGVVALLERR